VKYWAQPVDPSSQASAKAEFFIAQRTKALKPYLGLTFIDLEYLHLRAPVRTVLAPREELIHDLKLFLKLFIA